MTNDDATSTTSGPNHLTISTMPISKSAAFSDSGSVNPAPVNYPNGHPGTRASAVVGEPNPLSDAHAHALHVHTHLMRNKHKHNVISEDTTYPLPRVPNPPVIALAELAQLAPYEHKANPEKSVEQYYSERLGTRHFSIAF
ncbi:hypothetical protein Slin15195_G021540 [Septoria linicola]|uniref:Uncharacterized protein n=1 Tax=Septoria linicola TaxID=215465 RepID=A0A9Q9ALV4_9PEZI|nr:hypothetical protein Slin14017_G129510 [Septoria linicola]USW48835.1 hypothetical protein Slin15195_G021540 [Septoria linicola]